MNLTGKKVLVTGGTGMIGRELVELLNMRGAEVWVASLDKDPNIKCKQFVHLDLRSFDLCRAAVRGMDVVFHLAGIKGSPKMCREKPASFSVPMLQFNTNMMEAAMREGVDWYLYTSSIGVYHPEDILQEDRVWKTFPSENDKFAGWAKRMGELQAEAYAIELGKKNISIVRPANVYGRFDNFDPNTAMVIPSLIAKCDASEEIEVWGDGSQIRDFVHARTVASAMVFAVENEITEPLNVGSNEKTQLKEVVKYITESFNPVRTVKWDLTKPTGDAIRVLDSSRLVKYGFSNFVALKDGLRDTIQWYLGNKDVLKNRYNSFTEKV